MATTSDKVVVESIWILQDHASGSAKSMANHFNLLGSQIRITNGHLRVTQTLIGTAAFAGAAYGSFRLAKSVVSANLELEKMKYGIGAILLQSQKLGYIPGNKYKDMNDSLKEAEGVYQRLYVYAQKAVGTADDYTSAWRDIAMSVSKAGGGIADIERVAQLIVPLSKQLGLIPENAYRDIQQYLTGRMTVRDVVPRMIGLGNDPNYAKMTDSERLSKLITALESGREGAKAYEKTFEAQADTFKSLFVQLQREGGKGLFDQIKQDMMAFNQKFLGNEKQIYEVARSVTSEFTNMYIHVKDAAVWTAENFDKILATTKEIVTFWAYMKVGQGIAGAAKYMFDLNTQFKAWGGVAKLTSMGVGGLATQMWAVGPAILAAAVATGTAVRIWMKIAKDLTAEAETRQEIADMDNMTVNLEVQRRLAGKRHIPFEEFQKMEKEAAEMAAGQQRAEMNTIPKIGVMFGGRGGIYSGSFARDDAYINANDDKVKRENILARMITNWYKQNPREQSGFDSGLGVPKDVNVNNDFRGSRINITVDSRHADPNRVAATVISALGRAAKSRTGSNMMPAGSVAGG